jgi:FkbM family methyltransferase
MSFMKTFYSQQGEDFYIFKNLINQSRSDGTYLEVGAWDGVVYSNTKFFEDELNFKGILIEPIPKTFKQLCINRSQNKCYNKAIKKTTGMVTFLGDEPTAGVTETVSDTMRKANHGASQEYEVSSTTLSAIVGDASCEYLDMLFLDVEGGEQEVLESMDWDIPVYIVCIELDGTNPKKDLMCRYILGTKGFTLVDRLCSNEFWANPHYERKDSLFKESGEVIQGQHPFMEPHCASEIFEKCYTQ